MEVNMIKYIIKRFLMIIPVIIGISFLLFSVMELTPGDPARLILGETAAQSDVDALREEMGLNDNFFVRYVNYVVNALKGDFGNSYITGLPVSTEVISKFPATFKLAVTAMLIAVIIGIPIGIISAVKQYTIIDTVSLISSLIMTSMPGFWLGLMLILVFALKLDLFPVTGGDTWMHYVLPSVTLAASTMAILIRMTRSTMLEVIRQDYIRTAKSKGSGESRIIFKHALRNALLPIVTVIGINFAVQLGGSMIIENVFAIPGVGSLMIEAVKMKNTPVVLASVIFVALLGGLVNLAVDILYMYIDPRLRSQYVKG
jgi:peptide/nickel transport system permease protein